MTLRYQPGLTFGALASVALAVHTPTTNEELARVAARASHRNQTLWRYFFPDGPPSNDVHQNWRPHSSQCVKSNDCWCGHVSGSRHRGTNPHPQACEAGITAPKMSSTARFYTASCPPSKLRRRCGCTTGMGKPCLYSDMNPATSLTTIALMHELGVDHIIEEGREGGLSAFLYYVHGFRVTSVEFLPEAEPLAALQQMAPGITLLHGDGSIIIPNLVNSMTAEEAACTMIFYDGEKRIPAHKSFLKVRDKVAFAAFDDSNFPEFRTYLNAKNETWWETGTHEALFKSMSDAVKRTPGAGGVQGSVVSATGVGSVTATTFVIGGAWGQCRRMRHQSQPPLAA